MRRTALSLMATLLAAMFVLLPASRASAQGASLHAGRRAAPVWASPAAHLPDPQRSADAVVGHFLDALADADTTEPGRGVAAAFAFTVSHAQGDHGAFPAFVSLVREGSLRPLLHHRRVARGVLREAGDGATQRVVVTTADGTRIAMRLTLVRVADGDYRGCWTLAGATREAPSTLAPPQLADAGLGGHRATGGARG